MPPEHRYYKELNAHDGAYYRRWATVYGDAMVTLIDRILRGAKHEEQAYNSCKGILAISWKRQRRPASTHLPVNTPISRRLSAAL